VEDVIRRAAAAALAALSQSAAAQPPAAPDEDAYNEFTIRASHYPANAPRFEDYPAPVYAGPLAATQWRADSASRMFRTHLINAGKQRPNFSGRFTIATWGCGTDCTALAIIDVRTGKVHHPSIRTNVAVNVHAELLTGRTLRFRPDSRLLVFIGMPNEDARLRGVSFYEWTGTRLKRVRRVPVGWYPN